MKSIPELQDLRSSVENVDLDNRHITDENYEKAQRFLEQSNVELNTKIPPRIRSTKFTSQQGYSNAISTMNAVLQKVKYVQDSKDYINENLKKLHAGQTQLAKKQQMMMEGLFRTIRKKVESPDKSLQTVFAEGMGTVKKIYTDVSNELVARYTAKFKEIVVAHLKLIMKAFRAFCREAQLTTKEFSKILLQHDAQKKLFCK